MSDLLEAEQYFPLDHILNFDESNSYLVMAGDETVANVGQESVHQYTGWDTKANFTFFGTVAADGTKWPLVLLAKEKAQRCHKQLGVHSIDHIVWHSASGWCTENLMFLYLKGIHKILDGEPICPLMDQYTTHVTDAVVFTAWELGIYIIWIPNGATGRYQPLDKRVFGALKSKGKST
jgi:hypothetical protein